MAESIALHVSADRAEEWSGALERAGFEIVAPEGSPEILVVDGSHAHEGDETRVVRVPVDGPTVERLIALVARRAEQLAGWKSEGCDPVTGLPTREALMARIDNEIELSARIMKPFAVAIVDPDGLDALAAGLGPTGADATLREFGEFLATHLRRIDGVARWGAQEFGVVMPATYPTAAAAAVDRIQSRRQAECSEGTPTFSAGIATYPLDGDDRESLVSKAEERLLAAKRMGEGRIGVT